MTSSIKRDDLTGGLIFDADIKFKSYGGQDLYVALKTAWDADKFGTSTMDIFQRSGTGNNVLIHAGTIFHSDLKWKLINNAVEFKVDDASFYTKINANKSIESSVNVSQSKNLVTITPATSFDLEVHKVSNGTYYVNKRKAYRVYDCIRYMIDFMTDGTVGFDSECFDTGGIYSGYCLLSGEELIYHNNVQAPRLSFNTLIEDLRKRFNVRFAMVGSQTNPIFKLEPNGYWFERADVYSVNTPPDEVLLSVNQSLLYSSVKVGSERYETTSTMVFPDVQSLVAFREETLYFIGTNNIDRTLDLVGKLVVSNSSIDLCLEQLSGYEGYNDEVFLIHYDTATNKTISSDWVGLGNHFYNEPLNNVNILQRHSDSLPSNTVSNNVNSSSERFTAVNTPNSTYIQIAHDIATASVIDGPIQFDDDFTNGEDPGTNYGGATPQGSVVTPLNSYYTAPSNNSYIFTAQIGIDILGLVTPSSPTPVINNPGSWIAKLHFKKFALGVEIDSIDTGFVVMSLPGQYSVSGSYFTLLNAGETVEVYLKFVANTTPDPANLQFVYSVIPYATTFSTNGGQDASGIILNNNPEMYKCVKMEFKYPLTLAEYQTIRASKSGIIEVPLLENKSIRGWIENVKFDHYGGETSFSLITDGNTISR